MNVQDGLYDIIMAGTRASAQAHLNTQNKITKAMLEFQLKVHSVLLAHINIHRKECDLGIYKVKRSLNAEKSGIQGNVTMSPREKKSRMRFVDLQLQTQDASLEQHFSTGKKMLVKLAKTIVRDASEQLNVYSNYVNRNLEIEIVSECLRVISKEAMEQLEKNLNTLSGAFTALVQELQESHTVRCNRLSKKECHFRR